MTAVVIIVKPDGAGAVTRTKYRPGRHQSPVLRVSLARMSSNDFQRSAWRRASAQPRACAGRRVFQPQEGGRCEPRGAAHALPQAT